MYMSGLDAFPKTRAYVYYPPNVVKDPAMGAPIAGCGPGSQPIPGNPDGVYWTGLMTSAGCSATPLCFQTSVEMQSYASRNGETLRAFQNAQEVSDFCSTGANFQQLTTFQPPGPGPADTGQTGVTVPAPRPTGAPTSFVSPSVTLDQGTPYPIPPIAQDNTMLYAALGIAALFFLKGRR